MGKRNRDKQRKQQQQQRDGRPPGYIDNRERDNAVSETKLAFATPLVEAMLRFFASQID